MEEVETERGSLCIVYIYLLFGGARYFRPARVGGKFRSRSGSCSEALGNGGGNAI